MTEEQKLLYAGKAKSVYVTDRPGVLAMKFRDDITAFDGMKKEVLPEKGSLNASVSEFLFRYLGSHGVKSHFLRMADERTMIVRALRMIPLEVIVRNIAAGSMVKNLPVAEGTPLEPPVIVIDYKDDAKHDPMVNDDLIVALRILDKRSLARMKRIALRTNTLLKEYLSMKGILLVDFKLEFGREADSLLIGDEISMDSMRLWDAATRQSLDKDVYRFEKGDVIETYRAVAGRIMDPPGEGS